MSTCINSYHNPFITGHHPERGTYLRYMSAGSEADSDRDDNSGMINVKFSFLDMSLCHRTESGISFFSNILEVLKISVIRKGTRSDPVIWHSPVLLHEVNGSKNFIDPYKRFSCITAVSWQNIAEREMLNVGGYQTFSNISRMTCESN